MKNIDQWKPNRIEWNGSRFIPSMRVVYPGSLHIADLQIRAYEPLIQKYVKGDLLDCGCGSVPYYAIYKDQISSSICIDWEETHGSNPFLDHVVDLNESLPLANDSFDSILITDVFAHVAEPHQLMKEFSRVLRPGGHLVLTSPFFYWISEPPHEYFRYTQFALQRFCDQNNLEVCELSAYGGRIDVFLDMINKKMTGKLSNRIFLLLSNWYKRTSWYQKASERTRDKFPIGHCLVAKKKV
jgi:SAM-dependent methyltransferase